MQPLPAVRDVRDVERWLARDRPCCATRVCRSASHREVVEGRDTAGRAAGCRYGECCTGWIRTIAIVTTRSPSDEIAGWSSRAPSRAGKIGARRRVGRSAGEREMGGGPRRRTHGSGRRGRRDPECRYSRRCFHASHRSPALAGRTGSPWTATPTDSPGASLCEASGPGYAIRSPVGSVASRSFTGAGGLQATDGIPWARCSSPSRAPLCSTGCCDGRGRHRRAAEPIVEIAPVSLVSLFLREAPAKRGRRRRNVAETPRNLSAQCPLHLRVNREEKEGAARLGERLTLHPTSEQTALTYTVAVSGPRFVPTRQPFCVVERRGGENVDTGASVSKPPPKRASPAGTSRRVRVSPAGGDIVRRRAGADIPATAHVSAVLVAAAVVPAKTLGRRPAGGTPRPPAPMTTAGRKGRVFNAQTAPFSLRVVSSWRLRPPGPQVPLKASRATAFERQVRTPVDEEDQRRSPPDRTGHVGNATGSSPDGVLA